MISWKIKLLAGLAVLAAVAYSYVWTYNQGKTVGKAQCSVQQVEAIKKALAAADQKFRDQRKLEMREAAEIAEQGRKNQQRLAKDNQRLNELLKQKENISFAGCIVPDDVIELLNSSRGSTGTETPSGTLPPGSDGEVSGSSPLP